MRFSRLRLNGFKSFVDPTDLVIRDGLTGVVGPNGCGKSNLLEALRWVMGENRPTAMRGDGMEDVIFTGAATRPARSFAEVVVQIDNSARLAPVGFNDRDTLEIVRRVTRDAGSAYKVNTRDARARDVQMLFADASTGAHSPALVRQGQISELINARPRSRRRILEEAAGISGLYQRRHEAELKLKGAETNLARVDDVLEQLAGQLAQLARQARQAARYRTIGDKIRQAEGALLYCRWKEAEVARLAVAAGLTERITVASVAERAARGATQAREEAEAKLPPLREEETVAAAVLQRLHVRRDMLAEQESRARQAIGTLKSRIDQLSRDMEREAGLNRDAGETIDRLEQEQARLRAAAEGHDDRLTAAGEEAQAAARLLSERETALDRVTEDVARLVARHQSTHRLLADSRATVAKSAAEAARAREAAEGVRATLDKAKADLEAATHARTAAADRAGRADEALAAAEAACVEARAREGDARAERSQAEGEISALRAEVLALTRLVERDAVGGDQVLDAIRAEPGYEKALGAALADDLHAPQVMAEAGDVTGDMASGWVSLPEYDSPPPLPEGVVPLGDHVSAPDVLARRMGQIGLVDAADGPRLQAGLTPGQRLVSRDGGLWRWDGFRAGAGDAPAAVLRLQQMNRLTALKHDLEQAGTRAEAAVRTHEAQSRALAELTLADRQAREARAGADRAATEAGRAHARAEADRDVAAGRLETLSMTAARHEEEAARASKAMAEAQRAAAELGDPEAARAEAGEIRATVEDARRAMLARRSAHEELRREGEARVARDREITREISNWQQRLQTAERRAAELEARRAASEAELAEARDAPDSIATERAEILSEVGAAEARLTQASDALAGADTALRAAARAERDTERAASEAREARAAAQARADAAVGAVAAAALRITEERGQTPEALLDALGGDPDNMPDAAGIEEEANRLKRQRDALGAVNLRAEEDARAMQGEHDTLLGEKTDLEEAIRTLRSGIAGLNREGRARLLTAFAQVNENFSRLFTHLFGGGEARLVLVENDDPLEAGLEIMCQPPGKRLATLSLLSGGEQTLTALALIFAVFLANPAPICVLDEVDAPLDDANVIRFCNLLDEMRRRTDTRFLIITHHAVTMSRMDRLFGVTMAEQGVSQLVSVDLERAEALVA